MHFTEFIDARQILFERALENGKVLMLHFLLCVLVLALETQQVDLAKLLDTTQQNFDSLRDGVQKNMLWAREVVQALEKR